MRYLRPRGNSFQFERSVPLDVQPILGTKSWRESLRTDSRTEAERLCRKRTVETDEIIEAARSGSYRQLSAVYKKAEAEFERVSGKRRRQERIIDLPTFVDIYTSGGLP